MAESNVDKLIESEGFPRVSIYFTTRERGNDIQADALKLKNALKSAASQLEDAGTQQEDIDALLAEAHDVVEDHEFWRYSRKGLAVFIEPGRTRLIKLHAEPHEVTVVAVRYHHVRPLIHIQKEGDEIYILSVTRDKVRFLEAHSRGDAGVEEIDLEDAPDSIAKEKGMTDYDNDLGFDARARGSAGVAKFHALGRAPDELDEVQLEEFTRNVAKAVEHFLVSSAHHAPVVIAANDRTLGRLRDAFTRDNLVSEAINKDPASMSDADLVKHARDYAAEHVGAERKRASERLAAWNGGDPDLNGARTLDDAWNAAVQGRVETLFVRRGETIWGTVSEDGMSYTPHDKETAETEDLLNALAVKVLGQGGTVFAMPDDHHDSIGAVAAVFRY